MNALNIRFYLSAINLWIALRRLLYMTWYRCNLRVN